MSNTLNKKSFKEFIQKQYPDLDIETFKFTAETTRGGEQINALSKFEGVNCSVYTKDLNWERTATSHINWQLGIK